MYVCGTDKAGTPSQVSFAFSLFCPLFSSLLATFCLARQIMRSGSSGTVSPNVPIAYYLNYKTTPPYSNRIKVRMAVRTVGKCQCLWPVCKSK